MQQNVNDLSSEETNIQVYFHPQCEYGEVDDELIERLETNVKIIIKHNKKYLFSYINASNTQDHFKQFEKLKAVVIKQIIVLYRSYMIEDATEVENILLNDYKDDVNNINIRNNNKRIVNGGNDEYYVYIAVTQ